MKFSISPQELSKALTPLLKVIDRNPILSRVPAFHCVLVETDENAVTLTIIGASIQATAKVPAKVYTQGKAIIPALKLAKTVAKLDAGDVVMEQMGEGYMATLKICTSHGQYWIQTQNEFDYTPRLKFETVKESAINPNAICDFIAHTYFAKSTDEMKPAMNGVFCKVDDKKLTFVATNSHILAQYHIEPTLNGGNFDVIIPNRVIEILKIIVPKKNAGYVWLAVGKEYGSVKCGEIEVAFRLLPEKFPDYAPVIATDLPRSLVLNRKEFLKTLDRLSAHVDRFTKRIIINLGADDAVYVQAGETEDESRANLLIRAKKWAGIEKKVGFNVNFMMSCLKAIDTELVNIEFNDGVWICRLSSVEGEKDIKIMLCQVLLNIR